MDAGDRWVRISAADDNTEVLYFENAAATFYSFISEPGTITF